MKFYLLIPLILLFSFACDSEETKEQPKSKPKQEKPQVVKKQAVAGTYEILDEFPHDSTCFTQGLFFEDGYIYESGGMRGESNIRKVDVKTGKILKEKELPTYVFSEGICKVDNSIYMLTYTLGRCYVYDFNTFEEKEILGYYGQGWGIEYHDGKIYMSDGSPSIRVVDAKSFEIVDNLNVTVNGNPLGNVNELEFARGKLYANVWMTNQVVSFDPKTGIVDKTYDLTELSDRVSYNPAIDVLNGIAYIDSTDTFYLTGKLWPKLFHVKLN